MDLYSITPGPSELAAQAEHRLMIHAGVPLRAWCHSSTWLYTRGDVDILPAGATESWEPAGASTSIIVHLSPLLVRRAAEEMDVDPDRTAIELRHQFRDPQIEHIAWALDAERAAGYVNGRLYTESLGLALAAHLLGRYTTVTREPRGLSKPQLRRVTDYIDAHLDDDLSLALLASVAGMSASHLKTQFKRSTGVPVHEFVIRRRVARARELLVRGELPPSQVALEAGFAHQSHMARCMRRVIGVTPTSVVRSAR